MLGGFLERLVISLTFRAPFGKNTGSLSFSLATEVIHSIENMISIWLLINGGTDVSTRIWGPLPRGDITVYLLSLPRSCGEYSLIWWHLEDSDKIRPNHVDISNGFDLITDSDFVAAIDGWFLLKLMYGHFHTSRYYPSNVRRRPYRCLTRDILQPDAIWPLFQPVRQSTTKSGLFDKVSGNHQIGFDNALWNFSHCNP